MQQTLDNYRVIGATHTAGGRRLNEDSWKLSPDPLPEWLFLERARLLTVADTPRKIPGGASCVLYWMSRDQRAEDNWALLFARETARQQNLPLVVAFNLVPRFLGATLRHFDFMLQGLAETDRALDAKGVPLYLLRGEDPAASIAAFAKQEGAAVVFTDMAPLRLPMKWAWDVAQQLDQDDIPLVQVDAHNIVPVWVTSEKQEVGARTIRKKVHTHLPRYLANIPPPLAPNDMEFIPTYQSSRMISEVDDGAKRRSTDWGNVLTSMEGLDTSVGPVGWASPGAAAASSQLRLFCESRLSRFADKRNDPCCLDAISDLSPWLHFGQLSAQRAVIEVKKRGRSHSAAVASYVEEAVVRRELSENFCWYNAQYDSMDGAAEWARASLELHASDPREYIYDEHALESGCTHDDLWNAAQLQLTETGKMHGFLRMYWAKKILEWTPSPQEALRMAIYLNDRYELDGRDPNGYVGCMWSICGVHDMGWKEREVFGKIRFMNYKGCLRKFPVFEFVSRYPKAASNAVEAGGVPTAPKKGKKRKKTS
eukprot:CAMPEP_0185781614 /NCGR_PEP_ID=MMETSP1174-20130828/102985_1 /TAXON_ID=35687 /ORGANISM="Dictyocha speculum, Strain CCMP1381" /LENGTH=538 /DNA_ID=CAMNT_0028471663 /DNA_START=92 /DNA_END=1708 /DNA_ORIENTATION=-